MKCPLVSQPIQEKHHGSTVVWVDCIEEKCQWWDKEIDNCIVFDIAKGFKDLVVAINGAFRMLRPPILRSETPQPDETPQSERSEHDLSVSKPTDTL